MVEVGCCRTCAAARGYRAASRYCRSFGPRLGSRDWRVPRGYDRNPNPHFPTPFIPPRSPALDRPAVFGVAPVLGAIELAGNQFPIPSQNCIGLGYVGHLGQGFPPEALADLSARGPLQI